MTVVKQNDIIKTAMILEDEMCKINEFLKGKLAPGDLTQQEKNTVCKLYRDKIKNELRNEYNLCVDHQKMARYDFNDTWAGEVQPDTTTGTRIRLFNTKRQEASTADYYHEIELLPENITGFVNLRKKYQFFHINKISVHFVANSANNLTPIICKYLPPMSSEPTGAEIDQITKYAQSVGQIEGYMSVHSPYYLVQTYQVDDNGKVSTKIDSTFPVMYNQILKTDYENLYKINYGKFLFECKNILGENAQNFIVRVNYEVDFYTGIDYDNVEVGGAPDDDDDGSAPSNVGSFSLRSKSTK